MKNYSIPGLFLYGNLYNLYLGYWLTWPNEENQLNNNGKSYK